MNTILSICDITVVAMCLIATAFGFSTATHTMFYSYQAILYKTDDVCLCV